MKARVRPGPTERRAGSQPSSQRNGKKRARATLISFGYLTQYQLYSKQKTERKYDGKCRQFHLFGYSGDGVLSLFRLTHLPV